MDLVRSKHIAERPILTRTLLQNPGVHHTDFSCRTHPGDFCGHQQGCLRTPPAPHCLRTNTILEEAGRDRLPVTSHEPADFLAALCYPVLTTSEVSPRHAGSACFRPAAGFCPQPGRAFRPHRTDGARELVRTTFDVLCRNSHTASSQLTLLTSIIL